jgi:hypothetical protein
MTTTFIAKAKLVHGDKYDYSKVVYENNLKEVIIICKDHGEFLQLPKTHKRGNGCIQCGIISRSSLRTKSLDEFIYESTQVHGDKYDYSNVIYTNSSDKITIRCKLHGDFLQTPSSHIQGNGCKKCAIIYTSNLQRNDNIKFIKDAKEVHGDKYDYSKVNYINSKSKIKIICKEHGEIEQIPFDHLKGHGCPNCSRLIGSIKRTKPFDTFIKDAQEIYGNKYDYSKSNYVNVTTSIIIICKKHGEFEQSPYYHLRGGGCSKCCGLKRLTVEEFINRSNKIHKNVKKYSYFSPGDRNVPNITLFRGIKFLIYEVDSIKKNTNGQIETINTKISNKFENYKFSILLSHKNNGMYWDVIDQWKMDKDYKKADIVVYNDILYRAKKNNKTMMPTVNRNSIQIKAVPYNLNEDWEYYMDNDMIMFNPLNSQNNYYEKGSEILSKSVVYNNGDYYMFNGYDRPIDFWNPIIAYKTNSRLLRDTEGRINHMGYSKNSIVLYRGDYYMSTLDNNIYPPNYTQEFLNTNNKWEKYWEKIPAVNSNSTRWVEINIWNPSSTYSPKTYIVHHEILYISNNLATTISSGEQPGVSNLWNRLYSFVEDTNFNYQPNKNPLIMMNNEYYQIISNPWSRTLENGINIYINEKWKHVFVNIAINDNTLTNLSGKDRDILYTSLNKKLTAMNFIACLNNISNKYGFTDYINYIIVDSKGNSKTYNYNNIEGLPYIIFAEKPDRSISVFAHFDKSNARLYAVSVGLYLPIA